MSELKNLYQTALARKNNPQEGSYTSYLYEKGLNKILKKIGEETTEVVVAALSESKEELIGELNDLAYHLVVRDDIANCDEREGRGRRGLAGCGLVLGGKRGCAF